jgi:hypothetical protein
MKTRHAGVLSKQWQRKSWQKQHEEALSTSSFLTNLYRQMYQPMAAKIAPKKVVKVLREAGVVGLLLGTHGIGGYRSEPRATQDVDVLIKKRDHHKAIRAIQAAFPKLEVHDTPVVTRFVDPHNGRPVIDLMRPTAALFKVAFRFSRLVGESHRVPELELALVTKFAAMVSTNRAPAKKLIDAGDFVDIVIKNLPKIDKDKLIMLANMVYIRGGIEIIELVRDVEAGRPIRI